MAQQFVAHTFAFGMVLGLYLVIMLDRHDRVQRRPEMARAGQRGNDA